MKFGISTASLYGKMYTEEALAFFANNNVECAEVFLSSFCEYTSEFGKKLAGLKGNTEVYSIHTLNSQFEGQLFSHSQRQKDDAFKIFNNVLDIGERLGASLYVLHGPAQVKYTKYVTDYPFFASVTAELAERCKQHGMRLSWENVHWTHYNHPFFMDSIRRYLPENAEVFNTLDIKQASQSGVTVDEYIKDMKGRIANVHVVDIDESGALVLPGRGKVDFKALFNKLGDYSGPVMVEVYDGCYKKPQELIDAYHWLKEQNEHL